MSDRGTDLPQSIYYTALLLRRYHQCLTASEQALLVSRLQRLMSIVVPTIGAGTGGGAGGLIEGSLDGLPSVTAMEYYGYVETPAPATRCACAP